jgi:transposase
VAYLIAKNFEVDYHSGHVWRILRQLRWSVQHYLLLKAHRTAATGTEFVVLKKAA